MYVFSINSKIYCDFATFIRATLNNNQCESNKHKHFEKILFRLRFFFFIPSGANNNYYIFVLHNFFFLVCSKFIHSDIKIYICLACIFIYLLFINACTCEWSVGQVIYLYTNYELYRFKRRVRQAEEKKNRRMELNGGTNKASAGSDISHTQIQREEYFKKISRKCR